MDAIGGFMGMMIVLGCIVLPLIIVLAFFIVAALIAVGAMIPMYAAFGVGYLIKAIYRLATYIPPRRALVD